MSSICWTRAYKDSSGDGDLSVSFRIDRLEMADMLAQFSIEDICQIIYMTDDIKGDKRLHPELKSTVAEMERDWNL